MFPAVFTIFIHFSGDRACIKDYVLIDPACGSGNFLTETYLSLRRMENEVIRLQLDSRTGRTKEERRKISKGQIAMGADQVNPIRVSIAQFYGIEINDFAATVAKTALWIAESQMMKQTENIVHMNLDFLPLKSYANIVEGNALRIDWETVVPKAELNYIMGNPPFVGQPNRTKAQVDDMNMIFGKGNIETKLDYVICWYKKALDYIKPSNNRIVAAFVSTNSICQGESVPTFWKQMIDAGAKIEFAYPSFVWESEANEKAHVHCVIIGFATEESSKPKYIIDQNNKKEVAHINAYLNDAPDIWITNRTNIPKNNLPKMTTGSPPTDDGGLLMTIEEKDYFMRKYPILKEYIRPFIGAREFLHDKLGQYSRYCFWFVGASPSAFANIKEIRERLERVKALREASSADRIRKMALYPYLFCQNRQPETNYLVIPQHSSQNRRYIPIGYVSQNVIASNACTIIPNVSIYEFGILNSNVHNAWMRAVCGRIKSDIRYAPSIYNNLPRPNPTDAQRAKIEQTAQTILDARALYPDCSLADLYDEVTMPPELRKAHQMNDRAVMEAYGMSVRDTTEASCVAELMRRYQELTH